MDDEHALFDRPSRETEKRLEELAIAHQFLVSRPDLGLRDLDIVEFDPPDCVCLNSNGHLVAIEVTRLLSERYKSKEVHLQMRRAALKILGLPSDYKGAFDIQTRLLPPHLRNADFEEWTPTTFLNAVIGRLKSKEQKALDLAAYPGGYFVVIHTDEMAVTEEFVLRTLMGQVFGPYRKISRAFLCLDYVPAHGEAPGHYPVFELDLVSELGA